MRSPGGGPSRTVGPCGPGCSSARPLPLPWLTYISHRSLHLLEHLGEGGLDLERLLDLVAAEIGILPVFEKARTLVVADELDERGRVRLPVHREVLEVLERGVDSDLPEQRDRVLRVLVEIGVEDPLVHEPGVVIEQDPAQVMKLEG